MINLAHVYKRFAKKQALIDINLSLSDGESLALCGPNGAGKTTLLRILANLSNPTSGDVIINGKKLNRQALKFRGMIGFVGPQTLLYENLSAAENLRFYTKLYGISDPDRHINAILTLMDLKQQKDGLLRTFSSGMQQRLAIGRALLHDPCILLLDEPFNGLDTSASQQLMTLLDGLQEQGKTIMLASHNIERFSALCRRCIILDQGRIKADIDITDLEPDKLLQTYDQTVAAHSGRGSVV